MVSEHRLTDGTTRYGVRFELGEHRFKGVEVGKDFTAPKLLEGFAQVQVERQAQTQQQAKAAVTEFNNLLETGRLNALLKEGERAAKQRTTEASEPLSEPAKRVPQVARSLPVVDKSDEMEP